MPSKPILVAIVVGLFAAMPARAGEPLTLLSGDTSGVYFPLGLAIGKIFSDAFAERTAQVQVTQGSIANLNLLTDGKGELAFAEASSIEATMRGDVATGSAAPRTSLRTLGALYPNYVQIVASGKSGVRTLADLKGKRLAIGAPLSGTALTARKILSAAGLDEDEVGRVQELGFTEAITQMKDDKLDATLQSAGLGVASMNELSNTSEIVFVGIPPDVVAKLGAPFKAAEIPANTYKGQNEAVPSIAVMNYLVARADLPDAQAQRMTALIFDHLDILRIVHPATRGLSLATASLPGPLPMHPGATRYFREKGLMKRSDAEAINARGEARRARGEFAPALADFSEALRLDPENGPARDNRRALAREIERQGATMGLERTR